MIDHLLLAGPAIYPLLVCSVLVLALCIERVISLAIYAAKNPIKNALNVFEKFKTTEKNLREEAIGQWLISERNRLGRNTRVLLLLAALTPLLGLLGTVLGIITMFQQIAVQTGPVTPAVIADGMWEAMATTAVGLILAIPALAVGHLSRIWRDAKLAEITERLNRESLALELIASEHTTIKTDAVENTKSKNKKALEVVA